MLFVLQVRTQLVNIGPTSSGMRLQRLRNRLGLSTQLNRLGCWTY